METNEEIRGGIIGHRYESNLALCSEWVGESEQESVEEWTGTGEPGR